MQRVAAARFGPPPGPYRFHLVPVISVMLGSLTPVLPLVVSAPVMPPYGFLLLLGWRLLRIDIWPAWAAIPLGLFDDLFSGQPIGSAMALWAIAMLVLDAVDRQWIWRDHWQDWMIAGGMIAALLVLQLLIVDLTGGAAPPAILLPQWMLSALSFPLVVRACAKLDRWRFGQ